MNVRNKGWYALLVLFAFLCACEQRQGLAPVIEVNWRAANNHKMQHMVAHGETLYSIAFRYDQDYRQLALVNHLHSPYTLRVGQVIRLQPVNGAPTKVTISPQIKQPKWVMTSLQPTHKQPITNKTRNNAGWSWPIHGRVVASYAPQLGKKGIDIAGKKGERVHAASGGVVAYAGNGIVGYGNLIIIKHGHQYLTAYANNLRNLVREGQHIQAGQPIAEIGVVDRRYWGLHFEIRKAGKPVNPLNYLQNG